MNRRSPRDNRAFAGSPDRVPVVAAVLPAYRTAASIRSVIEQIPADVRHVIVVDTSDCKLYEMWSSYPVGGGTSWTAGSGAVFDLTSNALRPAGWTSADAAGLPVLPGLVRYDEVQAQGVVRLLGHVKRGQGRVHRAQAVRDDRGRQRL